MHVQKNIKFRSGFLQMRYTAFGFHKTRGISWPIRLLVNSKELDPSDLLKTQLTRHFTFRSTKCMVSWQWSLCYPGNWKSLLMYETVFHFMRQIYR